MNWIAGLGNLSAAAARAARLACVPPAIGLLLIGAIRAPSEPAVLETPQGSPQGAPRADTEYVKRCRKAASRGNARAQFNLGVLPEHGRGVPQDDAEASKWFLKAAGQGHVRAQNNLGFLSHQGRGMPRGYGEAAR